MTAARPVHHVARAIKPIPRHCEEAKQFMARRSAPLDGFAARAMTS